MLRSRALSRVTMLVLPALVAAAAFQVAGPDRDPRVLVFLGLLEGTIVLAWLANSIRRNRVWPAAMAAAGLAALAASNGPIAGFGVLMALVTAGASFPLGYGAPLAVLVVVLFEVIGRRWRSQPPPWAALETLGFAAAFVASVGVRRIGEEKGRTKAALAQLEDAREVQVRAARVAERVRLAREMHDVLGHTLSALALELDGARNLLVQRTDDPGGCAAVERAQRLARQGMEEARRAAGTLRGDRLPGPALLVDLVSSFERDSGNEARLRVDGRPVELAPEARLAIYRVAQEALSNVRKHARAGRVDVRLRYQSGGAELTVENDGGSPLRVIGGGAARSSADGRPSVHWSEGGFGLAGIRERAELLGGHLEAAHTEQGFRVRLWVPAGDDGGSMREAVVDIGLSREPRLEDGRRDRTQAPDNGMIKQS
ncbi:histidine kinase [Candidatus Nephthysia bennettiae]